MGRAERRARRASRKEARAIRKRAKGKHRRANKLEARAATLRQRSGLVASIPRVMLDTRNYSPSEAEVITLRTSFQKLRSSNIQNVRGFIEQFNGLSDAETVTTWNGSATAVESFGEIDNAQHFGNFCRRTFRIISTLESRAIFVKLENANGDNNLFGSAMPSLLNRPLSKNVRFKLYLNNPNHDLSEMMGTIVHEIGHTIVLPSPDPNTQELVDQSLNQSFRTPRRYEKFFLQI